MSIKDTRKKLNAFFTEKLETYGATPEGVDYNGSQAQEVRFERLVKIVDPSRPFTIIDYGCGYGAMFDYLHSKEWHFEYYGVDLIEKMVIAGRAAHKDFTNAYFTINEGELPVADYLIAGAIFNNITVDTPYEDWQGFTVETLWRMNALCSRGFSFNMLTKYSDADRMAQRPDLFFGDPCFFFDFCQRNFSHNVALLHDYGIFDFTILVRKDI